MEPTENEKGEIEIKFDKSAQGEWWVVNGVDLTSNASMLFTVDDDDCQANESVSEVRGLSKGESVSDMIGMCDVKVKEKDVRLQGAMGNYGSLNLSISKRALNELGFQFSPPHLEGSPPHSPSQPSSLTSNPYIIPTQILLQPSAHLIIVAMPAASLTSPIDLRTSDPQLVSPLSPQYSTSSTHLFSPSLPSQPHLPHVLRLPVMRQGKRNKAKHHHRTFGSEGKDKSVKDSKMNEAEVGERADVSKMEEVSEMEELSEMEGVCEMEEVSEIEEVSEDDDEDHPNIVNGVICQIDVGPHGGLSITSINHSIWRVLILSHPTQSRRGKIKGDKCGWPADTKRVWLPDGRRWQLRHDSEVRLICRDYVMSLTVELSSQTIAAHKTVTNSLPASRALRAAFVEWCKRVTCRGGGVRDDHGVDTSWRKKRKENRGDHLAQ
eukprot:GHVN01028963.1.p1 GENE.GHVN01028963.1~~GHVN01028963.1.p1  ORF type:complete len:436 (+),score=158.15 GHVN01028963.1:340-1647(+)